MTKEHKESTIASLLHERLGYERRALRAEREGNDEELAKANDRVAAVNAELKKLGVAAQKPARRAETRAATAEPESE